MTTHRAVMTMLLVVLSLALLSARMAAIAADTPLPDAKPVPAMQVLPLPDDQASFQLNSRELTRAHYSPSLRRPFLFPLIGPSGRSLTRMGHPHDPITHSHHNSLWISHHKVNGIDFWSDHAPDAGRIVHQRTEQLDDGDAAAAMLSVNHWLDSTGRIVMVERRRIEVIAREDDQGQWTLHLDLQLEAAGDQPVVIGPDPFGIIGVRMAKSIGVNDGGGRILNSDGAVNEPDAFRKPARWVDFAGPITTNAVEGVTLMDHPANPNHPAPFHVRNDGWMGACLTLEKPVTVEPGKPLRLRYGLWIHSGAPDVPAIDSQWRAFSKTELPAMTKRQ